MNIVTRDEYKTYLRIKKKLMESTSADKETQIPNKRHITSTQTVCTRKQKRKYGDDGQKDDDDESEDYEETETEEPTTDEDEHDNDTRKSSENDNNETDLQLSEPMKKKLKTVQKKYYVYDDIEYYKKLVEDEQVLIDDIETKIVAINKNETPLRFKILMSGMDIQLISIAINKVDQLAMLDRSSSEYYKLSTYIENISKIPVGKYKQLPISDTNDIEGISTFLDTTKKKLDEIVYGHKDAKDQIVRLLAKWISNPNSKGLVIGIEGVHGIGKTSLIKDGICEVLGLPFGFIPLGGISDGSYMVGHSYTYEGSRWGKIADVLMKVGCMNPVLFFDELDKISTTTYGQEIANLLIHITDSTQNMYFQDKYFSDVNIDLSRCLIIFSYNNEEYINPILKDRMTIIKAKGYTAKDKIAISKNYMLPKMLPEFGFKDGDIVFSDEVLQYIISITESEEGVRNLKRSLEDLVSQFNLHRLLKLPPCANKNGCVTLPLIVTNDIVNMFLKKSKDESNVSYSMMYL